jgi:hypothetical protein
MRRTLRRARTLVMRPSAVQAARFLSGSEVRSLFGVDVDVDRQFVVISVTSEGVDWTMVVHLDWLLLARQAMQLNPELVGDDTVPPGAIVYACGGWL